MGETNCGVPMAVPASKVDDMGRKIWDRSYYEERAANKSGGQSNSVEYSIATLFPDVNRKNVVTVPEVRENLKRRTESVELTKDLGKIRIINALTPKSQQGGFYCKTCDCLLKDSQAYMDHINGRKHNRMLGMTMRVEKVDAKTVAEKLKRLANQDSVTKLTKEELEKDAKERIMELEISEREMRERRRLAKKEKLKNKLKKENETIEQSALIKSENKSQISEISPETEAMKAFGLPTSFKS